MHLNPFAISGLLGAILYLPIFLFVLFQGKTNLSRIFSLHLFTGFWWGIGAFCVGINTNQELASPILKFAYSGVLFISATFYHSVHELTKSKNKLLLFATYAQAIIFLCLLLAGKLITNVDLIFNCLWFRVHDIAFFISAFFWIITCILSYIILFNYYKKCYPTERKQIIALFIAALGVASGSTNFLATAGLTYPWGNFFVPIHMLGITYAILKHQLLNIEIAIKRSIVYSIIIALISIFYFIMVFTFEKLVQGYLGYKSFMLSILAAFLIGIIFIPLRNRIQCLIDKIFFKATPTEIAEENEYLRREVAQAEKMKAIATLASGMAHEIRNPLTVIQTFFDQLPAKKDNPEFMRQLNTLVGKEVGRINDLVSQLLEFAKPSPLSLQNTNMSRLIDDILKLLHNQLTKHNITLHTTYDIPSTLTIKADPNKLKQVFLNLFLNAIEAMPTGGNLTVSAILNSSIPKILEVSISDTGCGIAPEDLKHIFEPFYSKKEKGTGLGLAIVKGIMEDHKGKVSVTSTLGQGTEFILEFPLSSHMDTTSQSHT